MESKWCVGKVVSYKLGLKCLVSQVFTHGQKKDSEEMIELSSPVYVLSYQDAQGVVRELKATEDLLEDYVAA